MKKAFFWARDNILFIASLFLLAFIPLYPKLPLLDIVNTWVYVRAEDFVVVLVFFVWAVLIVSKKITLKTPLTMPIIVFWVVGGLATLHGVLIIFPTLSNVFPNVAFLSFLRRIEYLSLFFIGYAAMRDRRFLSYVVGVIAVTFVFVFLYGVGQKYLGFPAYLTMNEEFAKGLPIRLSELSRVPSTFAGHYDLAAYIVFIVPLLVSMVFGYRNWFVKLSLLGAGLCGVILLFMTVSRVSFLVLFISLVAVLFFQKKKLVLFFLPLAAIFLVVFFLMFSSSLFDRFGNTVKQIDVLVDAKTGESIGQLKEVPASYFDDKIIKRRIFQNVRQLNGLKTDNENTKDLLLSAESIIFPNYALPKIVTIVSPPNSSTGENLPQGTGYVNLSLSPVTKRVGNFLYDNPGNIQASGSAISYIFYGDFLIKRASAYDLSFTTRYQGEWPHAFEAFKRNILLGSGYSSVSLAVDNNYLRILGEVGLLGFLSFFAIFISAGIYIRKVLPEVDSPAVRSFVLGFVAGVIGLALNAILIDVFDASKIAFLLWLICGITLGLLHLYMTKSINIYKELKKALTSTQAIVIYLCVIAMLVFSPMIGNYFVGDDFTWFRWAADCGSSGLASKTCPNTFNTVLRYFSHADGFFYRPGTKVYFLMMYSVFWLNQNVYHIISIFLHFIVASLLFLLAKKVFRDTLLSAMSAILFLVMSGYSEAVFWISATGHLINAAFIMLSLLFFIKWEEARRPIFFIASFLSFILSLMFHELGIITPLLMILYKFVAEDFRFSARRIFNKYNIVLFALPIILYFFARFFSQSHWFSGDYSYNLVKLPFNIVGNTIGYLILTLVGPLSLSIYELARDITKDNISITLGVAGLAICILILIFKFFISKHSFVLLVRKMDESDKKVVFFGFTFFIIGLLPFLGLGNITSRYSYLASGGLAIIFAYFIKKTYGYFLNNGRDIAFAITSIVVTVFSLLHIIQIQQLHSDWYEAGAVSERFFISIDRLYANYWVEDPLTFYFVNVPIKHGFAWVFPVGLPDALWFPVQSDKIIVNQTLDLEFAFSQAETFPFVHVFKFKPDGTVEEIIRSKKILP